MKTARPQTSLMDRYLRNLLRNAFLAWATSSHHALHHQDVRMTLRVIIDRGDPAEAPLLIEPGRLKAVGGHNDLRAATPCRFILGGFQQASAQTLPPMILSDPDRLELAAAAPGVAVQTGVKLSACGSKHAGQEPPVPDARCARSCIG